MATIEMSFYPMYNIGIPTRLTESKIYIQYNIFGWYSNTFKSNLNYPHGDLAEEFLQRISGSCAIGGTFHACER